MPPKKPKIHKRFGFTDRERQILKLLAMYKTVGSTARATRLKDSTIKSVLYRIRKRYDDASEFVAEYQAWRKKMPPRKYL